MESTYQALNKNITLQENIASFVKEITYKTTSAYPVVDIQDFQNMLRVRASGVMVMQVYDKATYIPAPGPVYVPWIEEAGAIKIYPITGLEADKTYFIRLVIF